ncbi:MAG: DUF262 domain-containing protein [Phycisphaeraceae bacterium]|nr:DUF262 domain-containing protein [Phycisphaeraceae bacterium]
MFDSTKEDLKDILRKADEGKLQLPDFQRDYVWLDEDVRSLIASICKGFPVGALLTLEAGSEVRFKPRSLAGVDAASHDPEELLLDGQQRVTSLYQATYSKKPVRTRLSKKVEIERYYYLDIKKSVNDTADLLDAIEGVPADRIRRTNFGKEIVLDLSSREREYEHDMFPLNLTFDSKDWFFGWRDYWKPRGRDVVDLEKKFYKQVVEMIEWYEMPIIRLDKRNSREAICLVFEKVNVGGKKLDPFELLTAIYAADNFDLRAAWNGEHKKSGLQQRLTDHQRRHVLARMESTHFMQACTLLHTREVRSRRVQEGAKGKDLPPVLCNRDAMLALPLTAFKKHVDTLEESFMLAAAFLNEQKIISSRDVPYPQQIVTLAAIFAALDSKAQTVPAKGKITDWFWAGALGELYGTGAETIMARDFMELVEWIGNDGEQPRTLSEAVFQQDRLRSLRGRLAAAYKAIHALLMRRGCLDFINGNPFELMTFFNQKIDVHHIFPEKWCKDHEIDKKVYDSIINKTPLSTKSNQIIGGNAPSIYLRKIETSTGISPAKLDDILRSHLIEPRFLRSDDFEGFYSARTQALSELIGSAMGKPVVNTHGSNEPEIEVDETSDEESDEELVDADTEE